MKASKLSGGHDLPLPKRFSHEPERFVHLEDGSTGNRDRCRRSQDRAIAVSLGRRGLNRDRVRFAQVDARFDAMLGVLEPRFARVDSRFDSLEARLESHLDRHAS